MGILDAPGIAATLAVKNTRLLSTQLAGGRYVGFAGDSITFGTGSSNASSTSFRAMAVKTAGQAFVKDYNGGVASDTTTLLLARFDAIISAGVNSVTIMIGTNDAGNATSIATTIANITAMVTKCRVANLPVQLCTIPPRGSGTSAAVQLATARINLWLRLWCPLNGIPLIDVYGALVDPTTGFTNATYDSDGTHPNDAGHLVIGKLVGAALLNLGRTGTSPTPPWPVWAAENGFGHGLLVNPLVSSTSNWAGVSTGTPTSVTAVASTGSDGLPRGQWLQIRNNNSGGGSGVVSQRGATIDATKWTVGDVLLVCFYAKSTASDGAGLKVQMLDQSNASVGVLLDTPGRGDPGPCFLLFTVPAGATALRLTLSASAAAGVDSTQSIGAADVFNLTSAGLTSYIV